MLLPVASGPLEPLFVFEFVEVSTSSFKPSLGLRGARSSGVRILRYLVGLVALGLLDLFLLGPFPLGHFESPLRDDKRWVILGVPVR